ncbi:carbohydrate-binding module family 1 protein [Parachaetomium inaequale]|uniref:lytic cellulose monooxygenase (C4-dehydrogenating) n=1 Tax=Parachaetomium inaequale TaxID=2588326 RepID=A0AAN6SLL9_9PEZI|nr:carbohydrate-binding module family 1 protein [Parachaetomium inaequale]
MKFSSLAVGVIAAQGVSAHYWSDTNLINNAAQPAYKYVRESTRATKYNPIKFSSNPAADLRDGSTINGPDSRCNQGAFSSAGRTSVLTVNAGDEIRLRLAAGAKFQPPDWFKIYEEGVCNQGADFTSSAWCDYDRNWLAAKIPKDTPNGEYLARFEHIGVHRCHVNQPEHYVSCLQVKVVNGGSGSPGPTVKFPGAYKNTDAYANFSIYNGFKNFPMPGPAVWSGGSGGNSGGGSSPQPQPQPTAGNGNSGTGCAALYGQCGGRDFTGAKCCASGTCKAANEWYSQCL